jgi:high-affinity Fe2+/Pb2+ permease
MMPADMYPTVTFTTTLPGSDLIAIIGVGLVVLIGAAVIARVLTQLRPTKAVAAPSAGRA